MIAAPSKAARSEGRAVTPQSRGLKAVLGPTNTGKTHLAIERMLAHRDGMIGLPLRLLAREVYDRVVKAKGVAAAALITGEEKIAPESARYFVCTVEAMPLDRRVDFLAVDEIQLARDSDRGHVFTDRILRARGDSETMLLGADAMTPMLKRLLPGAEIIRRERLSTLSYAGQKKLTKLAKRTAIVAFSAEDVYAIAELMRRHRGGAAVVMGALSPRTRNAQVALYQSGEVDFLVATDAIGMGLNMDVDHVAFAAAAKFDGRRNRILRPDEVAQIAGRAGRFENDGSFGETGERPPFDRETIERVESHEFEPVESIEWRNEALDFSSTHALMRSLEQPPRRPGLVRARGADDEETLRRLMADERVASLANSPAAVERLWAACQIPDFRKTGIEEHARLVSRFASALLSARGRLPQDWMASEIDRLDRVEGDLDVLHARIAHIRTWTYAANRSDWVDDADHWRQRTRAIEDRLSDALHDSLTQRFIDRRTSALLRGLRREEALAVQVETGGDVFVEGHHVGKLDALEFRPDPQALGLEGRAVRNAALRALAPEIANRLVALASAEDRELSLAPDGRITWRGAAVAELLRGGAPLSPRTALLGAEGASARLRDVAAQRVQTWLREEIAGVLGPLRALHEAQGLSGAARGLAFRMLEAGGALDRKDGEDLVRVLDADGREALSRLGVWVGRRTIFVSRMLKPRAARLWSLLFANSCGAPAFLTQPGAVSAPLPHPHRWSALAAAGFRAAGAVALRLDIVERLTTAMRVRVGEHGVDVRGLARLIRRSEREIPEILVALGYRRTEGGAWAAPPPHRPRRLPTDGNAFAALADLAPARRRRDAS
jgi:ATP-dependent RNA helicase SUPV3L1/SUV3